MLVLIVKTKQKISGNLNVILFSLIIHFIHFFQSSQTWFNKQCIIIIIVIEMYKYIGISHTISI